MAYYSTQEVADILGVAKVTLLRWINEGLIHEPSRDERGWRIWTDEDLERARRSGASARRQPLGQAERAVSNRGSDRITSQINFSSLRYRREST